MLDSTRAPAAATSPPRQVEYVTVRLAALEGGLIAVSLEATVFDEDDLQLLSREIGSSRVPTIDDALDFVRATVAFH